MTKFRHLYLFERSHNFAHHARERYPSDRQIGQSTRLINKYIQQLFTKGCLYKTEISDHVDFRNSDQLLMKRIIYRFEREHVGFPLINADISLQRIKIECDPERKGKTGKTTRLADKYIEDLFEFGIIHPVDHNGENEKLINIIMNRLNIENRHNMNNIIVENNTIEFLKYFKLKSITHNI